MQLASIDFSSLWTWFLLFTRFSGLLHVLPGVGTEEVPFTFRIPLALVLGFVVMFTGAHAAVPESIAEGGLIILTEFALGYLLGIIPSLIISSLALAGQVIAATIGLAQATLIDISLGDQVSVLSRLQSLIATVVFLAVDGHHVVIRAASMIGNDVGIGLYRPGMDVFMILAERFSASFELAVIISGPILVTILVTQFVLGLLTRFIPQVNIFIISLPLTIGVGLFIIQYTMPGFLIRMSKEFGTLQELIGRILVAGS